MVHQLLQCNRNAGYHLPLLNCSSKKCYWLDQAHDVAHCLGTQMLTLTKGQSWVQWTKDGKNGTTDTGRYLCWCQTKESLKHQLDLDKMNCLLEALVCWKAVGGGSRCLRRLVKRWALPEGNGRSGYLWYREGWGTQQYFFLSLHWQVLQPPHPSCRQQRQGLWEWRTTHCRRRSG